MLRKLLILILITESVVVNSNTIPDLEEYYEDNDITEETEPLDSFSMGPTPVSLESTTATAKPVQICTELKPDFISTRSGGYQTLECRTKICDTDDGINVGTGLRFVGPVFDWNSQFGHIYASNGSCDYERLHCWHSIDIDLKYMSKQMVDNGMNDIQLSCSVSDYLSDGKVKSSQWVVATDYSSLKRFKGKALDQSCDNDNQCGDNMFCLNSVRNGGTSCQCSVDFLTGFPYARILDVIYDEWICMPPLMINETCLHDQQCQVINANTVCGSRHTDTIDAGIGTCRCAEGMLFTESGCGSAKQVTSRPTIIWWIFTNDDKDQDSSSVHRFWWLRTASYLTAMLAILLPIAFILIALVVLCYRRTLKNGSNGPVIVRTKFPSVAAPKLIINDLTRKDKSDDKFHLVTNDHLIR